MMDGHSCPLCCSQDLSETNRRKDGLPVYLCGKCSLKFVHTADFTSLYGAPEKLYEKDYYEGQGDIGYEQYDSIPTEQFLWQRAFIELSAGDLKGKRILDVGCGTGNLIGLLNERGARAEGLEISRFGAERARSRGLHVSNGSLGELPDSPSYDIITAFDLIEHIPDVRAFFEKVRQLLNEQGVFIFSTPDAGSERAVAQGDGWYGFNSSLEHILYFSKNPLTGILKEIFGYVPVLYQAVAPDGEAVLGFIRKGESAEDELRSRLFASNFAPELITEGNALAVCILLHRMGDERFPVYADRFNDLISGADDHERLLLPLTPSGETGKVSVRPYGEGDETGIRELFRQVFGREMGLDEWRWKYLPRGKGRIHSIVTVTGDNTVVGHYGGMPSRVGYNGNEIRALASTDVMTLPQYRGFVTLRKIMRLFRDEAIRDGFNICHGFPTEKTLMQPAEKLRLIERCAPVLEASCEATLQNSSDRFLYRLSPMAFDDKRIDALWNSCREISNLAVMRDRDYLLWRYRDHPRFSYQCWGLSRRLGRELLGLAVTKETDDGTLPVMDLLFARNRFVPLVKKLVNLAHASGKKRIILWLPTAYHETLKGLGFTLSETATLARFIGDEFVSRDEMAASFYFTMGDTDYL